MTLTIPALSWLDILGIAAVLATVLSLLLLRPWRQELAFDTPCHRVYRPQTLTTVSGTVVAVDRIASCVHLTLQAGPRQIGVDLGPARFLERLDAAIAKGDRVDVQGSRTLDALIATELRTGDKTLVLRNAAGFPMWARP